MFRTQFERFQRRFFEQPGISGGPGGGGGNTPAPSAPAPAAPAAPSAPAGGTPAASGQPAAAAPAGVPSNYSYSEDRSAWIPPYRYQQLQQQAQENQTLRTQYAAMEQRLRALAGVAEPADPRRENLRQALSQVMPELAPLLENPNSLTELRQTIAAMQNEGRSRHVHEVARAAVNAYAGLLGPSVKAGDLAPATTDYLASMLTAYVQNDQTGERLHRFRNNDPQLMTDFMAEVRSTFIDPARRGHSVAVAQNAAAVAGLPSQGPSGVVGGAGQPPAKLRGKELREAARQRVLAGGNPATT